MRHDVQEGTSIKDALSQAGLDWQVERQMVFWGSPEDMTRSPKHSALVRQDTGELFAIAGKRYVPLQNSQAFDFIDALQEEKLVKLTAAGSFKGGAVVYVEAQLGEYEVIPGDVHRRNLLFTNSFNLSTAVRIGPTDVRVACLNSLMAALRGMTAGWSIRHDSSMDNRLEAARDAILESRSEQAKLESFQRALLKVHLSFESAMELTKQLIPGDGTKSHNQRTAMLDMWDHGIGQDMTGVRGTGYAFLNAVTQWNTHSAPVKGEAKSDARLHSLYMGNGARLAGKAISLLNRELVSHNIQI